MMAWHPVWLSVLLMMMSSGALAERWVTYTIDPKATQIKFHWTYMGMLSPAGQFSDAAGSIVVDLDRPDAAKVDVRIPVGTLKTFMPLIDGITKPVILSAKVPATNQGNPLSSGALSATTSFRRSDFGMNKMLGIVGDEMRVILQVRAQEAPTVASQ